MDYCMNIMGKWDIMGKRGDMKPEQNPRAACMTEV